MLDVLFQYGSFTLKTFNLLLALGFLFTGLFVVRYALRQKMNAAFLFYSLPYIFAGGLLGGRILYVIENWSLFQGRWLSSLFFWDLNTSFFGVLYGVSLALLFLGKKKKENVWMWFDAAGLALLTMMIFVHIGHFFNGTHYGLPTTLPWGIAFDAQNIRFLSPLHPVQLYAALGSLGLFLYNRKKDKRIHLPGVTGANCLMLYSLMMFGLGFLEGVPSLYAKITYLALSAVSFILLMHSSHKSHID